MSAIIAASLLGQELTARGLLPPHCRLVDVVIAVNGAVTIRYEVYLDAADGQQWADALRAVADRAVAVHAERDGTRDGS